MKITEKQVLDKLDGLPGDQCHCATLVLTTLHKAIKKFQQKIGVTHIDNNSC